VTIILGLMAVGLALRATSLSLTVYNIDEAVASIYATQLADLERFPLEGVRTSLGFHNPPLLVHLMAPLFVFTKDPRLAMFALAIAGTAAIGLTGLTTRSLWGGWAGVFAASLVTFSPNAVEHCRRLWGHDTMIFWTALCLHAAVRSVQTDRRQWMWLSLGAAAAGQACHLSGALLWVFPLGALTVFKPRGRWSSLAVGAGIAALLYLPWAIADAARGWTDVRLLMGLITGTAEATGPPSPLPPWLAWLTALADGRHSDLLYAEYSAAFGPLSSVSGALLALWQITLGSLLLVGLAALVGDAHAHRGRPADVKWSFLVLASALIPGLIFTALPIEVVPAYMLPALVPGAMAAGFALSRLRRLSRSAAYLLAIVAAAGGLIHTVRTRQFVAQAKPHHQVSTALRFQRDAIAHVIDSAGGVPHTVTQDGRAPAAGLDYQILHIHHWLTGDPRSPRNPGAPQIFVIRDGKTTLRPETAAWLRDRPFRTFGNLRVYHLAGDEARGWRGVVESYSSAGPR
jgi:hypothetical protein